MNMHRSSRKAFTVIELLVVIAIIAVLAVIVVLVLNPAELLRQSRDAQRVNDMATLSSALNLYVTDQTGASTFSLGVASDTYPSTYDPSATSTAGDQCQGLGMTSWNVSSGAAWQCAPSSTYRSVTNIGWMPVDFMNISAGSPIGVLPVDPTNQTSTGLFYAYNTSGSQFEVTADLESQKYKTQYGGTPQTSFFPEVISGGTPTVSALYDPAGLVGYWPLTEGSGSSTIDRSGNGNNGTWAGTPIGSNNTYYTGGKIGTYAGDFDGSTDEVSLGNPTALQVTTSVSVFAWVNRSQIVTYDYVLGNYWNSSGPISLQDAGNGNLGCTILNGAKSWNTPSNTFGQAGVWYQIGCTYNGSTMSLYINGVNQGSTSASGILSNSNGYPWYIGAMGTSGYIGSRFYGSIDDVRIYNRALSPAEVMALYSATK